MHILLAPDKFKGTLSAKEAAQAMQRGLETSLPDASFDLCPLSDGGEGLLEVLSTAYRTPLSWLSTLGPLGVPLRAPILSLPDGTMVLESAAVLSTANLGSEAPDPTRTSSLGLGLLIREVVRAGARRLLIGLGGTATLDGGAGLLRALQPGASASQEEDPPPNTVPFHSGLRDLELLPPYRLAHGASFSVTALCDVDNLLTGLEGSARVYGPQKGATPAQVRLLEDALQGWHRRWCAAFPDLEPHEPGDGAAGGLGFGLRAGIGATLMPGGRIVAEAVGLLERIKKADLVVTGEGCIDDQTLRGKVVSRVAAMAEALGVGILALGGQVKRPAAGVSFPFPALAVRSHEASSTDSPDLELEAAAANLGRLLALGQRLSRHGPPSATSERSQAP